MGYLAEEAVFMPLSKKVLEESDKFTCGNDDLDDFFQNDSIAYAEEHNVTELAELLKQHLKKS